MRIHINFLQFLSGNWIYSLRSYWKWSVIVIIIISVSVKVNNLAFYSSIQLSSIITINSIANARPRTHACKLRNVTATTKPKCRSYLVSHFFVFVWKYFAHSIALAVRHIDFIKWAIVITFVLRRHLLRAGNKIFWHEMMWNYIYWIRFASKCLKTLHFFSSTNNK